MHTDRVQAQDTSQKEEDVIQEVEDRLRTAIDAWSDNHDYAETDVEMRSGEQWDEDVVRQREQDKRPTLTFNRLETYIQQVVGNQRQNRPAIHVSPTELDVEEKIQGQQPNPKTQEPETYDKSQVIEGLLREIEYKSRAKDAYDTAFDHAVGNGFGYWRLVTEYASDTSFEQDIRIKRVRNPFAVYLDPAAETKTYEDATHAFITDWISEDEFKNLYPNAEPSKELPQGVGQDRALWYSESDKVRLVEYFRKVPFERRIALVRSALGMETVTLGDRNDDVDNNRRQIRALGGEILRERVVKKHRVEWRLINGDQVLEGPKEFPSQYIPIIPVFGREVVQDGETIYQSLIRHSHDAQKNYNYWRSAMTEMVALAPKSPYVGPASAFAGFEDRWSTANVKNWSFLPYNDQSPSPPQRQNMGQVPQGAMEEAQSADYDMKATIGMFEASLGEPSNERSGRAIMARRQEADVGTYIFTDNLNRAIEHTGRVIIDMIPRVYDTTRTIRIRQQDGEGDFVTINEETEAGRIGDVSQGKWEVAVSAGPSYQTQREEFTSSLLEISKSYPDIWKVAPDLLVKNMDWPGADKIAERLSRTVPPQVMSDQGGQQPTPQEQIQQAQAEAQLAKAEADKAKAQAESQVAGTKVEREQLQTQQDAYEKQTEMAQMLTRLYELEQKIAETDVRGEVQRAVSEAVTELAQQDYLRTDQEQGQSQESRST